MLNSLEAPLPAEVKIASSPQECSLKQHVDVQDLTMNCS